MELFLNKASIKKYSVATSTNVGVDCCPLFGSGLEGLDERKEGRMERDQSINPIHNFFPERSKERQALDWKGWRALEEMDGSG